MPRAAKFREHASAVKSDTPDFEVTPLMRAAATGDVAEIHRLIDNNAELEKCGGVYGWTPLMFAAVYGQADACRALVQRGALIDAQTIGGWCALTHAASLYNKPEAAIALIEMGADYKEIIKPGLSIEPKTRRMLYDAIEKKGGPKMASVLDWIKTPS